MLGLAATGSRGPIVTAKPDLSEFYKLSRPKSPPCKLGPVVAQLADTERAQWDAAAATDANVITNQALALWLERHVQGHQVNWQNCAYHRSRKCSCYAD